MGTNQQNLAALRAEVNGSLYYRGAMTSGLLDDKTLRGMAQMGFTTMAQGEAFNTALKKYPNLKGFMDGIGNQAVGNPRMDGLMRAVGSRYNTVLPYLSGDFADNPAVQGQLRSAIAKNPDAVARALSTYNGREDGPGKLETLLNNINNPPARAAPVQAAAQTRTAPPPRAAAARPAERPATPRAERPEAPADRTVYPAREVPRDGKPHLSRSADGTVNTVTLGRAATDRPDPATAVAGAGVAPAADPAAAAASVAPASGAGVVTAANVSTMATQLSEKLLEVFPDMANDIDGFNKTIQGSPELQSRIAQNLTKNPKLVEQMMQMAASKDEGTGNALRQYGRADVQELLNHPEKLADEQYVNTLSGKLGMASGGGGILDSIKNIFSGIDLGGIGDTIMGFLQPLIDMFKDLFAGFSANGGVSNVLTMGNGNGDMLSNALGNMQNAIDTGRTIREQQRLIERDPSVRAIDQNRDGKFDDADKVDVDGKGRKGFALEGISDQPGELKVYAERVDPKTGQLSQGSTFVVRNGQATRTSDNDNEPTNKPDQNRTLGQSLGAGTTGPGALNVPSPASGPPAPPAGVI